MLLALGALLCLEEMHVFASYVGETILAYSFLQDCRQHSHISTRSSLYGTHYNVPLVS